MAEVQIIQICRSIGGLALAAALPLTPLHAAREVALPNNGMTYVEARAAAMRGDYSRSATLFAALARQSADEGLTRQAIGTAISAGDSVLALQLMRGMDVNKLPLEARLLKVAEELRHNRTIPALAIAEAQQAQANISFLGPLIRAWDAAQRKDQAGALAALDSVPANGVIAPFRDQHRALILLHFRRSAEALSFAERSLSGNGLRDDRLRLVFADAFLRAGDARQAVMFADQLGLDGAAAKSRLQSGKPVGQTIDTPAAALSDLLMGLAVGLGARGDPDLPISLLQVARVADPTNSGASLLLGFILARSDRVSDALAVYRAIDPGDPFASDARQLQAGLLAQEKREAEALALASAQAARRDATPGDFEGLARVLGVMGRNAEAAETYGRAIALAGSQARAEDLWPLYLNQSSAFEEAGRWAEAKQALEAALKLAPNEPLILNNLGYGKLERGEDIDAAEAMIRKASTLAPDDASITDSLGWALYKQGRVDQAIEILQQAAFKDPAEPEIREHLGDALYKAGRRFEARFAWNAALVTADDEIARRVKSKLDLGLTPATAAP